MFSRTDKASDSDRGNETVEVLDIRPGGMLVQNRNPTTDVESLPSPMIRVDVKYGSSNHQIQVCPQASFGELKKVLAEKTGLHPDEQKILYKKKEKSSKMFLDIERVKDRSKLVLVEDTQSRERRQLEMIKTSNTQRACRSLFEISSQVDRFAEKVEELEEKGWSKGEKIGEAEIENITGNLLSQLAKLYELIVPADLKLQKINLERRAQKKIEILDRLRVNNPRDVRGLKPILKQKDERMREEKILKKNKSVSFVVSSTKWETFD